MRKELFTFQKNKLKQLKSKINNANMSVNKDPQVISFSAPTGSGKTIVMTALFEDIFFGAIDFDKQPEAVIVWLSDMPELNEQTRLKIKSKSDKIKEGQLITIDASYSAEHFDGGKVYFLNTQKLGYDKSLTQKSDFRQYTIWETLTNTAKTIPNRFYVVIDEAHRGMNLSNNNENTAQSIMQKFLLGSIEDGLCQMPLVIGITATPQRFQRVLANTTSTVHNIVVSPDEVKDSGLIKDRIIIHYPDSRINADMAMFKGAIDDWIRKKEHWAGYCKQEDDKEVKPILVVQVEDGSGSNYTRTDMSICITMLEEVLGRKLIYGEVVHTFNGLNTISICGIDISYIEPSCIEEREEVNFVFFKMNLSTGWDCPRAEVMMSFRSAQDYTYISQLLGRMLRTPLARRIKSDAELNDVSLFLPYYNEETVKSVINTLKDSEDNVPSETGTSKELVTLKRNNDFAAIFFSMNNLITYKIDNARKQSSLKLLSALSRALTQHLISPEAQLNIRQTIVEKMNEKIIEIKDNKIFDEKVNEIVGVNMNTLEFIFGEETYVKNSDIKVTITEYDIDNLFERAGKFLGDGLHMKYWKKNIFRDPIEVKLEVIVLVNCDGSMRKLNEFARNEFLNLYESYKREIANLNEERRNVYEKLILSSDIPVPIPWQLPDNIGFTVSIGANVYEKHLFVENNGNFRVDLNNWEREVLSEELDRGAIAWFRNLDRKSWSFQVPYEKAGILTPMFPDLIIVRKCLNEYSFDILEPHDPSRSDNYEKAKGLAKFAEKHWTVFGRIQLIRKMKGSDGANHYYRLDMSRISTRNKVRSIVDNHALDELFNTDAFIE